MSSKWDNLDLLSDPDEDLDFQYLKMCERVTITHTGISSEDCILLNINQDGKDIQIWMQKKAIYGDCSGIFKWALNTFYAKIRRVNSQIFDEFNNCT